MAYQFPPDVDKLVREQMAVRGYGSEDELLRDALQLFQEFQVRKQQLLADVQTGIDQADQGLARPLDLDALVDRCIHRLVGQAPRA